MTTKEYHRARRVAGHPVRRGERATIGSWGFRPARLGRALRIAATALVVLVPCYAVARALALADFDFTTASLILGHTDAAQLATSGIAYAVPVILFGLGVISPLLFDKANSAIPIASFAITLVLAFAILGFTGRQWYWLLIAGYVAVSGILGSAMLVDYRKLSKMTGAMTTWQEFRHDVARSAGFNKIRGLSGDSGPKSPVTALERVSIIGYLCLVTAYSALSLHAQPVAWITFEDNSNAVPSTWMAEANGGTMFLLANRSGDTDTRMRWHAGSPATLVFCGLRLPFTGDGNPSCATEDTAAPPPSSGLPSATPPNAP